MDLLRFALTAAICAAPLLAADDVSSAVVGSVKKVDSGTKTVVVKATDGTEHTFHFVGRTSVQGGDAVAKGSKDAFKGLKEGDDVAVHYSVKGADKTAEEVDRIGKDGMKASEGAVTKVDHGAKTITMKTADGTEQTYHLADHAAHETASGAEKAGKVTVYYTEDAGKKIVHFLKGS
jgi:hypothetical protein